MRVLLNLIILLLSIMQAQSVDYGCKTESMPVNQLLEIKQNIETWSFSRNRNEPVHIIVAWHIVTQSNGVGDYGDQIIYDMIDALNDNYVEHNFFFTLESIDRTDNDTWFVNWEGQGSPGEDGMQTLAIDPYHYLNIYTADLNAMGAEGWSYLPNGFANNSHLQSVNLDYRNMNVGLAWMLTHEVGHHLGLDHTFSGNCTNPNDGIDDTPQHNESGLWSCNSNQDTCPNDPGNDPVTNYMNYIL